MKKYTSITIIYNPNSTGSSKDLAESVKSDLKNQGFTQKVTLMPTKYAGHAEKIAYKTAKATLFPLIISSSGDGGYSEVVNGVIKAQSEGAQPVVGLLAAGNANDHFKNVYENDIVTAIVKQKIKKIDLLKLTSVSNKVPLERYAHSYIGIGLTPKVGKMLNKTKLNKLNEIILSLKTLVSLRPTKILVNGETRSYYSLVATNLSSMAKVLKMSEKSDVTDGKFELVTFKKTSKWQLVKTLLKSATIGLNEKKQLVQYKFKTITPTLCQLDGEVLALDSDSNCEITIEQKVLRSLY